MRQRFEHGRLENGAAVSAGELDGAAATAMATAAATVAALRRRRAKMRWRRGGGRCLADGGERVEGEAGRGCRAVCVAGAWRPRGERVLTSVGALVWASGRRRGGRPGQPVRLGRKGGGGPVRGK